MKISHAAEKARLPVKTVRYYADIGLVAPADRSASGYRSYDQDAVQKLIFIRRARAFGFSITKCRELLGLYVDDSRSSADVKEIAKRRLAEIEEKQKELQYLHDELAHLITACHGDDRPDCPIISGLAQPA